jgi:AraC-like DNA-binding protein
MDAPMSLHGCASQARRRAGALHDHVARLECRFFDPRPSLGSGCASRLDGSRREGIIAGALKPRIPGKSDAFKTARYVRAPALGVSELSYIQTSTGAAPPDVRSALEVILVDEADKTIVHRGKEQHIRTGLVGIRSAFEAGRLVRRHAPETRVRIVALADRELAAAFEALGVAPNRVPPVLTYLDDPALWAATSEVFSAVEAHEPTMGIETRLSACAMQVVRTMTSGGFDTGTLDTESAERIREVLYDCIAENMTLDELARDVGLSRAYVVHAFQRVFQLPPYEYLMHLRVAKARVMLMAGQRPIDVAHACGFCDQSHMNRWFRAVVGVTPGKYGPR